MADYIDGAYRSHSFIILYSGLAWRVSILLHLKTQCPGPTVTYSSISPQVIRLWEHSCTAPELPEGSS